VVLGGSEDGGVYVWEVSSGKLIDTLRPPSHPQSGGAVFAVQWHAQAGLMASAAQDGTLRSWVYEAKRAAERELMLVMGGGGGAESGLSSAALMSAAQMPVVPHTSTSTSASASASALSGSITITAPPSAAASLSAAGATIPPTASASASSKK
jgi:WD40 repeat protein